MLLGFAPRNGLALPPSLPGHYIDEKTAVSAPAGQAATPQAKRGPFWPTEAKLCGSRRGRTKTMAKLDAKTMGAGSRSQSTGARAEPPHAQTAAAAAAVAAEAAPPPGARAWAAATARSRRELLTPPHTHTLLHRSPHSHSRKRSSVRAPTAIVMGARLRCGLAASAVLAMLVLASAVRAARSRRARVVRAARGRLSELEAARAWRPPYADGARAECGPDSGP